MHGHAERAVGTTVELATTYGLKLVGGILILVGGWIVAAWAVKAVVRACRKSDRVDRTLEAYLAKVARGGILVLTAIAVLSNFGVETTSIIAMLGAMAVAIGLALRETLSNIAYGIVLLVLRPFKVGETIDIGGTVGEVKEVGVFATELRTGDGLYVLLPNSQVWAGKIINLSRYGERRFDLVIGIGYRDDADRALKIIEELIAADSRVHKDPAPSVKLTELGESAVKITASGWASAADFGGVRLDLMRHVKDRFAAEGITVPFPQREVHLVREPEREAA